MSLTLALQSLTGSFFNMASRASVTPAVVHPAEGLASQLGKQTWVDGQGLVHLNIPLVEAIVGYREQAVPALTQVLAMTQNPLVILEGLYTAQRLAETKVPGVRDLYGVTSRWNSHPNPLVQIYLAGFYRALNIPETFGPLLATLVNQAAHHYETPLSAQTPLEEVGGTVLQQIAERTADATVKRLVPYLNRYSFKGASV